jgi:hypothetical protein
MPKKSSSKSLFMVTTQRPGLPIVTGNLSVLKIWLNTPKLKENKLIPQNEIVSSSEKALNYEQEIYDKDIRAILAEFKDAPFLEPTGTGVGTIERLFRQFRFSPQVDTPSKIDQYIRLLCLALYVLHECNISPEKVTVLEMNAVDLNWGDPEFYRSYFRLFPKEVVDLRPIFTQWWINTTITISYVDKCVEFTECLVSNGTLEVIADLKEIIRGLYILSLYNIVHNDMHSGNILVVNLPVKKRLIYDFDRCYKNGFPNPMLTDGVCDANCGLQSQCNRFNQNIPTDFYKLLYYVFTKRSADYEQILAGLNIYASEEFLYMHIWNGIIGGNNSFFSIGNCSYLQDPSRNPEFQKVTEYIGKTWDDIFNKVFNTNLLNPLHPKRIKEKHVNLQETNFLVNILNLKKIKITPENMRKIKSICDFLRERRLELNIYNIDRVINGQISVVEEKEAGMEDDVPVSKMEEEFGFSRIKKPYKMFKKEKFMKSRKSKKKSRRPKKVLNTIPDILELKYGRPIMPRQRILNQRRKLRYKSSVEVMIKNEK